MQPLRQEGPESATWGKVLTFYSYKGGVGRSMALANVAAMLARWGHRVLIIDWDLEAPGLHEFFSQWLAGTAADSPGIVDMIKSFRESGSLPWRECLLQAKLPEATHPVHIITAGKNAPGYAEEVQQLDWGGLFEQGLGRWLDQLRNEWATEYDYVLIDSRTGITDIGGICTVLLPDIIVVLFTASNQSVEGAARVMAQVRRLHHDLPVSRGRLLGIPVPSRDESKSDPSRGMTWSRIYAEKMAPLYADWVPRETPFIEVATRLYLPYRPEWSFGERLPVVEGPELLNDTASLQYAYARLATLVSTRINWNAVIGTGEGSELVEARAQVARVQAQAKADAAVFEEKTRRAARSATAGIFGFAFAAVAIVVGLVVKQRSDREATAARVLATVKATPDPLLATMVVGALRGLPDPGDGIATLQSLARGQVATAAYQGPSTFPFCAGFTGKGDWAAVCYPSLNAVVLYPTSGHGDPIAVRGRAVALDEVGNSLQTTVGDSGLVWTTSGHLVARYPIPDTVAGDIPELGLSPSGTYGFSLASWHLQLWRLTSDSIAMLKSIDYVQRAVFSGNGEVLALALNAGTIAVRPLTASTGSVDVAKSERPVVDLATNHEGSAILFLQADGAIRRLDRGPPIRMVTLGSSRRVDRMASLSFNPQYALSRFSQDGKWLALAQDSVVLLRETDGPEQVLVVPPGRARNLMFSQDGGRFLVLGLGGVRVWNTGQSRPLLEIPNPGYATAALSPDGRTLLTVSPSGAVVFSPIEPDTDLAQLATWDALVAAIPARSTACLTSKQRVQFLGENESTAKAAADDCERSFGRTPGRLQLLMDSISLASKRSAE